MTRPFWLDRVWSERFISMFVINDMSAYSCSFMPGVSTRLYTVWERNLKWEIETELQLPKGYWKPSQMWKKKKQVYILVVHVFLSSTGAKFVPKEKFNLTSLLANGCGMAPSITVLKIILPRGRFSLFSRPGCMSLNSFIHCLREKLEVRNWDRTAAAQGLLETFSNVKKKETGLYSGCSCIFIQYRC